MQIFKKISIILSMLFLAAFTAEAGEAPLDITTSLAFRCTTNFGYNLTTQATGLSTVINWLTLSFNPIGYKTLETPAGDPGKPYTYFSITGLDMGFAANPTTFPYLNPGSTQFGGVNFANMIAKLIIDPFWLAIVMRGVEADMLWDDDGFYADRAMIASRTCFRVLRSGGMGAFDANSWPQKHRDLIQFKYATTGRLLVGFDNELFTLIAKIGSRNDWTINVAQEYAFGLDAELRLIPNLTIGLDAYGTTYVDSTGDPMFSAKAAYDIPLFGALYLQPFAAFDGQLTVRGMKTEIAAGINIPWLGGGYKVDPIYILDNGEPTNTAGPNRFKKNNTFGGLTLGGSIFLPDDGKPATTLVDASIYEAQGDDGLFLDWGMVFSAQVYNLLGIPEYGAALYVDYELLNDSLRPLLAVMYRNYDQTAAIAPAADELSVHTGIHYIAIPGATIGLEYDTGNLIAAAPVWGNAYAFLSLAY